MNRFGFILLPALVAVIMAQAARAAAPASASEVTHHVYVHLVAPPENAVVEVDVAPPAAAAPAAAEPAAGDSAMGLLFFIFALAIFLGFELISRVPSQLHTPLMSGSNAISGITIVGALIAAGRGETTFTVFLGVLAVAFAMINVVGGYLVTDRMLAMFKHKD